LTKLLKDWFNKNKIESNYSIEKLNSYIEFLSFEKNIRNIIGTSDIDLLTTRHIIPSLDLGLIITEDNGVDVGSGNGLPGVVIAILKSNTKVALIEPKTSRVNFLNKVKRELDIKNISIIQKRGEDAGKEDAYREKFGFGTCRAVSELRITSELILPLLKIDGRFYAQRGKNIKSDIDSARSIVHKLGGDFESIKKDIVIIIKKETTPQEYPKKKKKIINSYTL